MPSAVSSVVPVPWASGTKYRGAVAAAERGIELGSAERGQVGGERRDGGTGGAAGAVLEGRVQPAAGLVAHRAGPEPADDVRGVGVVGHHDDLRDRPARGGGGDRVGQQREHQFVVEVPPNAAVRGRRRVFATASRFAGTTIDHRGTGLASTSGRGDGPRCGPDRP